MATIERWRAQINTLDTRLLRLLNRRARIAQYIGRFKRQNGRRLWVPARERTVLDRLAAANSGPLDGPAVRRLFRLIIRESRRSEAVAMSSNQGGV